MANVLTGVRLLLALPLAALIASNDERAPYAAAIAIVIAIVTDLADGPIARRRGTSGAFGGTFDHATDCVFVVCGLVGGVLRGVFPWLLPVLVVTAFTQYTVDSYWFHRQGGLRGSRLGRYNGILYFFPLCGDTLVRLGLGFLRLPVTALCWMLILSTCISIGERFMLAQQARQSARASRAEQTAEPSRR